MQYPDNPHGLTVTKAAGQLGIGRTLLYDLIRRGILKPVKLGRRTVIPASQVAQLLTAAIIVEAEGQ